MQAVHAYAHAHDARIERAARACCNDIHLPIRVTTNHLGRALARLLARSGCNISRKEVAGRLGEATRPPLTYPRPDKPFSEPIPRPCTPSVPLYARSEQSQRAEPQLRATSLKNGTGSSYFRSPFSPYTRRYDTTLGSFRYSVPLMRLKFRLSFNSFAHPLDATDASCDDKFVKCVVTRSPKCTSQLFDVP